MANPPTGTVTFLFTDIEGSTRRWERQPRQMQTALARHDELMRRAIEAHGGYVFKTVGDAFYATFTTASDALNAAIEAQHKLSASPESKVQIPGAAERDSGPDDLDFGLPLRVRMALHTGAAEERDGDYFGQPLNRVARLLSAGHGGQILLSLATQELTRDNLPVGVTLKDMGEHRLKDLIRPERVFQVVAPGSPWALPSEFPPLKTLDSHPNNLPLQHTPLIGREVEIAAVVERLRSQQARLLTLTGPGGTGKTRLGLQAAAEILEEFNDGVYFVNLAPITDPELVVSTIAQALGVSESPGQPLPVTLKDYLRDKQILLLIDNFEQVVEAATALNELLEAAPRLKMLVTSRLVLRLYGEHDYAVPPLSLPDVRKLPPFEKLGQYEAVRLFIERAQAGKADFAVSNENAPAVAEICARLDGLPLAIELAAARVRLLPPQAILQRLQSRLRLLTGGARDVPTRQQTLRNTIEWSYELLDEGEKALFRRLAVFVGGRTLEAIEAICNANGDLVVDVLDGMASLVDESLLRQDQGVGGEPRFVMLETIHEYAREKLEESGEAAQLREYHAGYFLALAWEADSGLMGAQQANWLERLEEEHDNLRAALDWSINEKEMADMALQLAGTLWRFWLIHDHFREGYKWLQAVLAHPGSASPASRAKALYAAGVISTAQGNPDSARHFYEQALPYFTDLGDKQGTAWVLNDLGSLAHSEGNLKESAAFYEESLALKRQLGDSRDVAVSLNNLAEVARARGDFGSAAALLEESIIKSRGAGDTYMVSLELNNLAYVKIHQHDYGQAESLFRESLALGRQLGSDMHVAGCLAGLAGVAGAKGQALRAAKLFGSVEPLLGLLEAVLDSSDRIDYDHNLESARAQLDEVTWSKAWAQGRAMTMEQAIAYALEES